MLLAIEQNLNRGIRLLQSIDNQQYTNASVKPYHSSIGGHMRHILDVFDCIFEGLPYSEIDLTARKRNALVEEHIAYALDYFEEIIAKLRNLKKDDLEAFVKVTDDLGLGKVTSTYTLGAILVQAHSHAIHHFASLGYIISELGIELPDADFGYNPTTPRDKISKN